MEPKIKFKTRVGLNLAQRKDPKISRMALSYLEFFSVSWTSSVASSSSSSSSSSVASGGLDRRWPWRKTCVGARRLPSERTCLGVRTGLWCSDNIFFWGDNMGVLAKLVPLFSSYSLLSHQDPDPINNIFSLNSLFTRNWTILIAWKWLKKAIRVLKF